MKSVSHRIIKKINDFFQDTGVYWDSSEKRYLYKSKRGFLLWWTSGLFLLAAAAILFPIEVARYVLVEVYAITVGLVKLLMSGLAVAVRFLISPLLAKKYVE